MLQLGPSSYYHNFLKGIQYTYFNKVGLLMNWTLPTHINVVIQKVPTCFWDSKLLEFFPKIVEDPRELTESLLRTT